MYTKTYVFQYFYPISIFGPNLIMYRKTYVIQYFYNIGMYGPSSPCTQKPMYSSIFTITAYQVFGPSLPCTQNLRIPVFLPYKHTWSKFIMHTKTYVFQYFYHVSILGPNFYHVNKNLPGMSMHSSIFTI